jgi:hypothetical protein
MTRALGPLLALLLAITIAAGAAACAKRTPSGLEPCSGELETLCSKVDPGAGRLLACLGEHDAELSPACRQRVTLLSPPKDSTPMRPQAQQACRMDMQVHCSGVEPGGGRLKQCLLASGQRLSPPCKAALEAEAGVAAPAR